jgi:hypothetical protein
MPNGLQTTGGAGAGFGSIGTAGSTGFANLVLGTNFTQAGAAGGAAGNAIDGSSFVIIVATGTITGPTIN